MPVVRLRECGHIFHGACAGTPSGIAVKRRFGMFRTRLETCPDPSAGSSPLHRRPRFKTSPTDGRPVRIAEHRRSLGAEHSVESDDFVTRCDARVFFF